MAHWVPANDGAAPPLSAPDDAQLRLGHPGIGPGGGAAPNERIVIVSNRLPVTVRLEGSDARLEPSSGGLATGLRGVHEQVGAIWIGWCGATTAPTRLAARLIEQRLSGLGAVPVHLDAHEVARYYQRYANGVLWPVLHDRTDAPPPDAEDWRVYRAVNARFADTVARQLRPGDRVWVHDYHLLLVPRLLRERCPGVRVGFFLHTPFPSPDALAALPWPHRVALLDGLLGADLIGFHTADYAARFTHAVRVVLGRHADGGVLDDGGRRTRVHVFPMGIDSAAFAERASRPVVTAKAERLRRSGGTLLLGVDRLDYTKGIPERLEAFARLLERNADLRGRVRLIQLAVPSREDVPAYRAVRARVEALVARINARFGSILWKPVHYVYASVDAVTLAVLYRAADVMLVTPLRDGMNLVAKEFVASRTDGDGVLVLSAHAGAAAELRAAVLVEPSDVDGLADAYRAALEMSPAERRTRMRHLRERVHSHDVFRWSRAFLDALGCRGPAAAHGAPDAAVATAALSRPTAAAAAIAG